MTTKTYYLVNTPTAWMNERGFGIDQHIAPERHATRARAWKAGYRATGYEHDDFILLEMQGSPARLVAVYGDPGLPPLPWGEDDIAHLDSCIPEALR